MKKTVVIIVGAILFSTFSLANAQGDLSSVPALPQEDVQTTVPETTATITPSAVVVGSTAGGTIDAGNHGQSSSVSSSGDISQTTAVTVFFNQKTQPVAFDDVLNTVQKDKTWAVFPGQGFNAHLTKAEIDALKANPNVGAVEPVRTITTNDEDVINIVGASQAWTRQVGTASMNGAGQTICILDTGVDFSNQSLTHANILGHNLDCYNAVGGVCADNGVTDTNGHGTHVAGDAAANGAVHGVAPGANIISLKIFNGSSNNLDTPFPIQNAVNWCRTHADQYNVSAISMSLGAQIAYRPPPAPTTCDDISYFSPINAEINAASAQNISVLAATGNQGATNTINWPACVNRVIAVGATNKDDTLASYSNYNSLVKIFAPGTAITSTGLGGGTSTMSGTSMSTPEAAGAIAILNQYYQSTNEGVHTHTPEFFENVLYSTGVHFSNLVDATRFNIDNALLSVDHIPPTAVATTSATIVHVNTPVTFSCSAADWQLSSVSLLVNGWHDRLHLQSSEQVTGTSTQYSSEFSLPKVGQYQVTCRVVDANGNVTVSPAVSGTVTI